MEVTGTIKLINETQTFGEKGFRKRECVVTTEEQYPQDIMIEFVQDKTELLDSYKVGQNVKVSINLRGRCWTNPEGVDKYFNGIQGWRIEEAESNDVDPKPFEVVEGKVVDKPEEDDLPF